MNDMQIVGESLVESSRLARSSARSQISVLFPYVVIASKRMSTRAISAFLKEHHEVSISAATIAKALREPQKHITYFADTIEPAARQMSDALDVGIVDLLTRPELFDAASRQPPSIWGNINDEKEDAYNSFQRACKFLKDSWWPMDPTVRAMALAEIERVEVAADKSATEEDSSDE